MNKMKTDTVDQTTCCSKRSVPMETTLEAQRIHINSPINYVANTVTKCFLFCSEVFSKM